MCLYKRGLTGVFIRKVLQVLVLEKCDNCLYIRGATCVCIREQ